jgi:hypothetical protein
MHLRGRTCFHSGIGGLFEGYTSGAALACPFALAQTQRESNNVDM